MSKRCLGCMELFGDEFNICPHCGYRVGTLAEEAVHMEPGTLLHDRYIIGKVLGYGGFGVTYIGWDGKLEQKVAVKEYLPSEFSTRMPGQSQVTVFNGEKNEQFHDGLKKFVEEAKHLAKFQNEGGIVKIFDSFEENDTAYIIMEYLDGETLTSYLKREKTIPEDDAVNMLIPVMHSLSAVHKEGLLHRDIAPDNIFLTKSGEVKLIDFGASRYATTSHSKSLTVIIKPGYSPEEQYRSNGDQGPHTDVYAIAATLYKMITGKTPPDSMERRAKYENQNKDILEEPHKINKNISINRENAILNAMNVRIEDRTPDIESFMRDLNADPPVKRIYGKIKKIDIYSWPLWIKILIPSALSLILVFGALLLTGVIKFSNYTEEIVMPEDIVTVPDVEGLNKDEALKLIEEGQLIASTGGNVESEYITEGKIILQTPAAGSYMDLNGTVLLMISSGKGVESPSNGLAVVPYVIWDTKEDAVSKLIQAGLGEPEIVEQYDDSVAFGSVISQSIEAGTKVDEGQIITITVSLGAAAFDMPKVTGLSMEDAEKQLGDKGLIVKTEYKKDENVPEGNVISQSIREGESVKPGDEVTITVSSGRDTKDVANVVGKIQADAEKALKEQGFKVKVLENYDANVALGKVISQSPDAGSSQLPGSTVVIYVSKGKQSITITFDANGGSVSTDSKSTYVSEKYGDLPQPTRTGYSFQGWYLNKTGGTKISSNTDISSQKNHTLYAQWKANSYTVSFNANGGNVSKSSMSVTYDSAYVDMPVPTRNGYSFKGWYTSASAGSQVTSTSKVSTASNHTLYAQWEAGNCNVTLNANGGAVTPTSITVTYNSNYGTLPTPTRTGHSFNGWFTAASGGTKVTSSTKVTNSSAHTLYAQWSLNKYTVSFDASGGTVSPTSITVTYSSTYGTLPTPTRKGYSFSGWYTSSSGGTNITSSTKVTITSAHTLYAQWKANTYKINFNANGGNISTGNKSITYGSAYGDLPTPTRDYYSFNGWFTAASGGEKVSSSTKIGANDVTVYAQWTLKPISGWVLSTNVPAGAQVVEKKWTYTRTQTTESTNTSLSGWTQSGSYWKQTGTGSVNYASFPSGFDTSHYLYSSFAHQPYFASETATTKREVSNTHAGYIYWHWMYNVAYANEIYRYIADRSCVWSYNNWSFVYFYAIASEVDCPLASRTNVINYSSSNTPYTYNCHSILPRSTSTTDGMGCPRFLRFDYYKSTYTDYQKVFQYKKVTTEESSSQVYAGGEISNVQYYVKYREK